jgi:heme-degrading monooxygenase HmoA
MEQPPLNTPGPHRPSNGEEAPRPRRRWALGVVVVSALGVLASVFAVGLRGCAFGSSFRGEGRLREIAREGRSSNSPAGEQAQKPTVMVGLTNAVLDPKTRAVFDDHTHRVLRSLPQQPGYVGHAVRTRPFGNEVWTMTVWQDEQALDAFVASDVHREAIRRGLVAVRSARFARFEWPADRGAPTWAEALRVLEEARVVDYSSYRRPATTSTTSTSADR